MELFKMTWGEYYHDIYPNIKPTVLGVDMAKGRSPSKEKKKMPKDKKPGKGC